MSEKPLWKKGGGFLLARAEEVYAPEDFDETVRMIAETTRTFVEREVLPVLPEMEESKERMLEENPKLMKKAGELGLLAPDIPEEYGGLELPKVVSSVIAENLAEAGGFAVTVGAHTGIGTLPIVYFGTEEQKRKYLPKLASGEWISAYALTEPGAGSDALGIKATATPTEDGKFYVLNGTKQFISNAGFAQLFIVFAKVNGEQFTAFLVERDTPGLSFGPEEHKMGIKSSSTRQVILEDVKVPAENVVGEIEKGHKIAFLVLDVGRYKLGAGAVGGAKVALRDAAKYAKQRVQFGLPIAKFGAIQEKLARIAIYTYAAESATYRTVGLIDEEIERLGKENTVRAIEEYAVEASIIKVLGSEVLDYAVDEAVQVHGGYGYIAEYPVERAYRDSRINRIFEGTNEINRLLIPGMMLRRALKGELPLYEAAMKLQEELLELAFGEPPEDEFERLYGYVEGLKKLALMTAGIAAQKFGEKIVKEEEVLLRVADIAIAAYAAESALLRAKKRGDELSLLATEYYLTEAMDRASTEAQALLPYLEEGSDLRMLMSAARRLTKHDPVDRIGFQKKIAEAVLEAEGYPF